MCKKLEEFKNYQLAQVGICGFIHMVMFFILANSPLQAHKFNVRSLPSEPITLRENLQVYSLKEPFAAVGVLNEGTKISILGKESSGMLRIRFWKSVNRLVEAQCKMEDLRIPQVNPVVPNSIEVIRPEKVTLAFSPRGDARGDILKVLKRAQSKVDVTAFFLRDDDLIDALCYLSSRKKVRVRVVASASMASAAQKPLLQRMADYGVEVIVYPKGKTKMHMKAAVIDEDIVITGCANWTSESFDRNIEDTLIIESPELALIYQTQINALIAEIKQESDYSAFYRNEDAKRIKFPAGKSSTRSQKRNDELKPFSTRSYSNVSLEAFLLPETNIVELLQQRLIDAEYSIDIGMYLLTNDELIDSLCEIAGKGSCKVRVWVDQTMLQARLMQNLQRLWDHGVDVQFYQEQRSILHLKAAVIDNRFLISGSANWTENGLTRNVEDLLIFDSVEMAKSYQDYFERVAVHTKSFASHSLNQPIIQAANNVIKRDPSGYALGLPPTFPRIEYEDIDQARQADGFTVDAHVKYLPDEEYLPVLLKLINTSQQSILVAMYLFSEQKNRAPAQESIISALERAVKRGVYVMLLLEMPHSDSDRLSRHHANRAERLREKGIDVRLDLPRIPLHSKMVVSDLSKILVGSHNWSEGALMADKVMESSALVVLDRQEPKLMDYICSRKTISDMSSRSAWEREIGRLRALAGTSRSKRPALIRQFKGVP